MKEIIKSMRLYNCLTMAFLVGVLAYLSNVPLYFLFPIVVFFSMSGGFIENDAIDKMKGLRTKGNVQNPETMTTISMFFYTIAIFSSIFLGIYEILIVMFGITLLTLYNRHKFQKNIVVATLSIIPFLLVQSFVFLPLFFVNLNRERYKDFCEEIQNSSKENK